MKTMNTGKTLTETPWVSFGKNGLFFFNTAPESTAPAMSYLYKDCLDSVQKRLLHSVRDKLFFTLQTTTYRHNVVSYHIVIYMKEDLRCCIRQFHQFRPLQFRFVISYTHGKPSSFPSYSAG